MVIWFRTFRRNGNACIFFFFYYFLFLFLSVLVCTHLCFHAPKVIWELLTSRPSIVTGRPLVIMCFTSVTHVMVLPIRTCLRRPERPLFWCSEMKRMVYTCMPQIRFVHLTVYTSVLKFVDHTPFCKCIPSSVFTALLPLCSFIVDK
jgi:hypothetical protein